MGMRLRPMGRAGNRRGGVWEGGYWVFEGVSTKLAPPTTQWFSGRKFVRGNRLGIHIAWPEAHEFNARKIIVLHSCLSPFTE